MARGETVEELGLSAGSFATQVGARACAEHDGWLCSPGHRRQQHLPLAFVSCNDKFDRPMIACQASSASRARRVVLAGAAVLALACVAVVAIVGGEAVKTGHVRMELSDRNEFESSPAWCARTCVCTGRGLRATSLRACLLFLLLGGR